MFPANRYLNLLQRSTVLSVRFYSSFTFVKPRHHLQSSFLTQPLSSHHLQLRSTTLQNPSIMQWNKYSSASSHKLEVNGIHFHYEKAGSGEHTVLLLPGALGSSETDFRHQIDGLSRDKYTVISFDPRGYGKSRPPDRDWPLRYLHRDAEDAAAFMQKLGVPRYSVLGWSDGGVTGMILAGAHPENVKKLLIWGANSYVSEKDLAIYSALESIDSWSERMKAPFIAMYGEEYFRDQWAKWVSAISRYATDFNGDICKASLPNIACSTLIVNGIKDQIVPQEHPVFLQKHIPNCRTIEWPEGKHNLHIRYHQEFNQLAEDFLDVV